MHYMQERCPERVYLIGGLCEIILNGRGQISSACVGLGERIRKKPQVSSLDKNVLFTWCDRVNDMSTWCDRVNDMSTWCEWECDIGLMTCPRGGIGLNHWCYL
jgi:hypothetical protein